ncbi:hypothetical protein [Methylopila sp. 73B]|uniref:hypothetical protein n=1 Tax=Methylopila sp. 73B TaxID=1120792 RepID=UPI00036589E8|nr:hypothetical protein [Methylopila sp. 73B]
MTALLSIGGAVLRTIGLNPQRVATSSEGRVPGRPTFGGMDYQLTGLDERATSIEAETMPFIVGGLDALGWLELHHQRQDAVPYIRLQANFLGVVAGNVIIRSLDVEEGRFHPFTGVGRQVTATIELLHVGSLL